MLALKSYAFSCLLDTRKFQFPSKKNNFINSKILNHCHLAVVVVVPRLLTPTDSSYKMAVQT